MLLIALCKLNRMVVSVVRRSVIALSTATICANERFCICPLLFGHVIVGPVTEPAVTAGGALTLLNVELATVSKPTPIGNADAPAMTVISLLTPPINEPELPASVTLFFIAVAYAAFAVLTPLDNELSLDDADAAVAASAAFVESIFCSDAADI
jgi:hypothetical protein